MHAEHAGSQERLRIQDRPVDVRFRREIDDGVGRLDERRHDVRIGDVALHEPEARGGSRIGLHVGEVGAVARVRELVEDRDARPVVPGQDVADEARADEAGSAGDQQPSRRRSAAHRSTGRWRGRPERPVGGVVGGELGGPQQRRHRPGVGPVALVHPREEAPRRDVVVEDVGDLELAAAGRGEVVDDVERVGAEEVDADRDEVALGVLRLLLEADDVARRVQLGDAEPLRVRHAVEERAGAPRPASNSRTTSSSSGPRRMLSPRTTQNASSPTKFRARPMAWAMPSAPRWYRYVRSRPKCAPSASSSTTSPTLLPPTTTMTSRMPIPASVSIG